MTSAQDVRRWLRALTSLDQTALAATIARATARLADGPDGRGMGYAIDLEDVDGIRRHRKSGNTSSYAAYVIWSTTPAVGVAVLTSCGGFRRVIDLAVALHDVARAP